MDKTMTAKAKAMAKAKGKVGHEIKKKMPKVVVGNEIKGKNIDK